MLLLSFFKWLSRDKLGPIAAKLAEGGGERQIRIPFDLTSKLNCKSFFTGFVRATVEPLASDHPNWHYWIVIAWTSLNRKRSISGNRSVQEPGLYYLEKHQFIRVQFWRSSFIRAVLFSASRNFSQTLSRAVHTANIVFRLSHVVTSDRYPLQNVTLKVNLLFLKLDRAYSISFDSSNVSNFLFLNEF